jgi:hypothetical protein
MSNPVGVGDGHGPVGSQLLTELANCLAEWQRAFAQGSQPVHPQLAGLRDFSAKLIQPLRAADFGGAAAHLNELMRRVDAGGIVGDPRESLGALLQLLEQARGALQLDARAGQAQRSSYPQRSAGDSSAPPNRQAVSGNERIGGQRPSQAPAMPASPASPMDRPILGLRAFGAREQQSGVVGRHSGSESRPNPQWNAGNAPGAAREVKELLGNIEPTRGRSASGARAKSAAPAAKVSHRPSRAYGIAVVLTSIGLVSSVIAVVMVLKDRGAASSAPAAATSVAAAGSSGPAPAQRTSTALLAEDEAFSSLLAQVHGRGKESSELQALVNEQAALAARALAKGKCEASPAECEQLAKLRGQLNGKRITKRRAAASATRTRAPWLAGLELPEIPIEDDPRVQRSLEYYTERPVGRELLQGMLFRCGAYRELIESTLIRHGLPKDLIAVVFVESGCEPEAVSPVGAAGLWQLMPDTARAYNLHVKKSVVDERRSAPKSTEAAVRFLRDLHDKMATYYAAGVWDLVFASYNLGPFGMAARLENAGGDIGFWDLVDAARLPDETAQYAPSVQAMALILHNLQHFKFAGVQLRAPQLTSDLQVPPGTRLSLIARAASTSLDRIRSLNLDIMSDRTPDVPNFAVQVPKEVVWQARDTVAELTATRDEFDQCVPPSFDWGRKHFTKEMADACQRKLGGGKASGAKQIGPTAPPTAPSQPG